jgi:hypothetical protein
LEVVVVVAAPAAKGESDRETGSAAACPPDSLLVVEAHGGHIRHHDRQKRADIDTSFHRRRNTEKVNDVSERDFFAWETDVLKQPLSVSGVIVVCLSGEFFAVESEQLIGFSGQETEVVNRILGTAQGFGLAKWI